MKKVKHWLHILLTVLTSGLWLLPYVVILACTEQYNRGYRAGKMAGRVERQNEVDDIYVLTPRAQQVVRESVSRIDRFAELAERNRTVGLDAEEGREYFHLRAELSR